ncbi:16S rRNA (uracil(1498)-N(3))-methyltransferase [Mangrovactinospora gilvigrisea]|uniref:Ribosomal RNA small subunit methyltransferase E n=1 Tax=Mangrovactinospora gilvigrisea TaxID=1428644 RepID=A0A1J7C2C9_9ACTN|nr:16S rRNA (uracil(1498)-N(3))-methyltransferase [Mangrovactinospora gilvigrisea]OIV35720.1 16S rRNA (uracil(1498)-N(3))-methyltransferase [Mangrovactinospora gilvigrisea]
MTAPVFVVEGGALARAAAGDVVPLDGPEGRHAAAVKRLRAGEAVVLADGAGRGVDGVVDAVRGKDGIDVRVEAVRDEAPPAPRVTVVQALPKGDRGELAVETMTEVGVDAVVPWSAARCVTRWSGPRGEKALGKWRATAREAGKQARRLRFPEVAPPASTAEVAERVAAADVAVVLHEAGAAAFASLAASGLGEAREVLLVVGPEGGIAPEELERFTAAGASVCRLGPSVLRTSTAGVVAAGLVLAASGRWR